MRTDQLEGRFLHERYTNTSYGAAYGQTTSPLADAALAWVRASNGLSYVRCYNWLGDGVPKDHPNWFAGSGVARKGPGGDVVYQWEGLERVLDTLLASGVKPYVVCGGLPDALLEEPVRRNESGAAANRPKDPARYADMLSQMFRRLVKTYGAPEVRTWYFEVWSQPDHEGSLDGGRPAPFTGEASAAQVEPFCRLYDQFAAAAHTVDDKIRVGGPGLAGDRGFLERFLEHCARGANSVTGRPGTRLDFISWHRYGDVADVVRANAEFREGIEQKYPELKSAEFVLCETAPGPASRARANEVGEAARLAALFDANARSPRGVDLMFRAGDLVDDHFDGSNALISRVGDNSIPLPAFRLYMLLAKMGSERLRTESPAGVGVIATQPGGKGQQNANQALLYRYEPGAPSAGGEARPVKLRFTGLSSKLLRLPTRVYRINRETYAPYETWAAAGGARPAPAELGRELAGSALFPPASEDPAVPVRDGEANVEVTLAPNETVLVTLGAEPSYSAELCPRAKRLRRAEEEYLLIADHIGRRSFPKAEDGLRKLQQKYADTFWAEVALYSLVSLYEVDMKSPAQAEAARRELLALPLNDIARLRLLERLRVDALRKGGQGEVESITGQIRALEARLAAIRQWPLKRYQGE